MICVEKQGSIRVYHIGLFIYLSTPVQKMYSSIQERSYLFFYERTVGPEIHTFIVF